jgi:N-acetylglucosaminyldiphosphoundecaprenol N-acetyl-beta-D-mannosaminyltransferase
VTAKQSNEQSELKTLSVMGLPVHQSQRYIGWLNDRIQMAQGTHVITLNAEMCMQAQKDLTLSQLIKAADLVVPDGSGIELYFRLLRGQALYRYPGIELAADLLKSLDSGTKVAFYGGKPEIVSAAADYWRSQNPQLNLAIVQHGYVKGPEFDNFLRQLEATSPDLIFVGLGVPRQEFWIADHRALCLDAVWIGVGGSYDIWSGSKVRAPMPMRNLHLEWLYRLYQEPWRWRRMLALPQFAWSSFWYGLREQR